MNIPKPKYFPENIGLQISQSNLRQITGYSQSQIFGLMGLAAISGHKEINIISGIYPQLYINIRIEDSSCEIARTFLFGEKIIVNELFEISEPYSRRQRIGTKVFCSQVSAARMEGFEKITAWAAGNFKNIEHWNGYITWGKLGFTMDADAQSDFDELMKRLGRNEKTLKELLSIDENCWVENGFSWDGEFSLLEDSDNIKNLLKYLSKSGLKEWL